MSSLSLPASFLKSLPDLGDHDFTQLSRLVHNRSGIYLAEDKRILVKGRLGTRLRALGLSTFREYHDLLLSNEGESEMVRMLDVISTHLTDFFRSPTHFEYLKSTFFAQWKDAGIIRILCAGCSTGEEPYTVAICAREFFGAAAPQRVQITAMDISSEVIAKAKSGIYDKSRINGISPERTRAFFLEGTGSNAGLVRVAPEIQSMVSFHCLNLMDPLPMVTAYHAIFCRNVIIYFNRATQEKILRQFHTMLAANGSLFLGATESILSFKLPFDYVEPTIYQKR